MNRLPRSIPVEATTRKGFRVIRMGEELMILKTACRSVDLG
jgi:hypothetical protein